MAARGSWRGSLPNGGGVAVDDIVFLNRCGSVGIYKETSAYIPGVVLTAALEGYAAIPRLSRQAYSGLLAKKDDENWQLWLAQFNTYNEEEDEWFAYPDPPLASAGSLSYGDAVSVVAVPVAEMLDQIVAQIAYDRCEPVIVSGSEFTLTKQHHNKLVLFRVACSVSVDLSGAQLGWCSHLVQGGSGQITLTASPYHRYQALSYNVAYAIPAAQYKRVSIMDAGSSTLLVTL